MNSHNQIFIFSSPVTDFVFHAGQPGRGNKENCLFLENEMDYNHDAQDAPCKYKGNTLPLCQQVINDQ